MKCYKCNKQIPSVSTICPYCSTPVDVNYKPPIEFGDISSIDYDNKHDLKAYIQEPKNRKVVILAIVSIIIVFIVFISLILAVLFPKKERNDKYFIETLDSINDYIEDNFLGSNYAKSGEYKLNLSINGVSHEFNGHYERDINKRILKLDGVRRDPNEHSGGIILDNKEFSFDTYMKDNNLYFKSDQLFSSYLNFELPDKTGLLTTKNYNLDILLSGIYDGLKNALAQVTYNQENVNINYRGVETNVKRYYFALDNREKINFIKNFYDMLIDDANFINEYARLNDKKSEEVIELFKNKITDAEFRYSGESNDLITFSIYINNKKIIRFYVDIASENHRIYQLDIKDGKYFFDYYLNDKNEISATLIKTEETIAGIKNVNYAITFDNDEYVIDIVIDFKPDERAQVKRENIENYRDFGIITEEEKNILKTNLLNYTNRNDLVDILANYFKEKCVLGIECNCEENKSTCSCLVDGNLIECEKEKVTEAVQSAE